MIVYSIELLKSEMLICTKCEKWIQTEDLSHIEYAYIISRGKGGELEILCEECKDEEVK